LKTKNIPATQQKPSPVNNYGDWGDGELHMLPGMGWGLPDSPGHYLDFTSAALACALLIAGMIWISVNARRSR
jgi:hypothetical protein